MLLKAARGQLRESKSALLRFACIGKVSSGLSGLLHGNFGVKAPCTMRVRSNLDLLLFDGSWLEFGLARNEEEP